MDKCSNFHLLNVFYVILLILLISCAVDADVESCVLVSPRPGQPPRGSEQARHRPPEGAQEGQVLKGLPPRRGDNRKDSGVLRDSEIHKKGKILSPWKVFFWGGIYLEKL